MPISRGRAAPVRAASDGRRPCSSAASHAMIARADDAAADAPQRLGARRHAARDEREARPLVVGTECERREHLAAEPARPDAVARVAGAVVDPRAPLRAEERQMVGRDVDRAAPRPLDAHAVEAGRSRRRPASARAAVGPRGRSYRRRGPRSRSGPSRCPSARARRSSCGSSAGTSARRRSPRPRPADRLERVRRGLRQHDVRAEVREAARRGSPTASGRRSWRARSPARGGCRRRGELPRRGCVSPACARARPRPRRARPAAARARAAQARSSRRRGRRHPAERAMRNASPTSFREREPPPRDGRPRRPPRRRVDRGVLRRRRRDHQHPGFAQPHVLPRSSANARTPGTIASAARASRTHLSPSTPRVDASDAQ